MKKLSKLKLNDVAILSDGEMKNVVGGFVNGTGAILLCWCNSTGTPGSGDFDDTTGNCTGTLVDERDLPSYCPQGIADCSVYLG